jgi:hypothetical protein
MPVFYYPAFVRIEAESERKADKMADDFIDTHDLGGGRSVGWLGDGIEEREDAHDATCTCPADLRSRGGWRSTCPAHGTWRLLAP